MESRKRFDSLQEELGIDIEFRGRGGMVVVETQEELEAMRLFVKEQKKTGLEVTLLDRKQARELEPSLSEGILACTYSPLDGQVNPICVEQRQEAQRSTLIPESPALAGRVIALSASKPLKETSKQELWSMLPAFMQRKLGR
jgi:glycine/D-amino acid oxidase-like deaminating enzyme